MGINGTVEQDGQIIENYQMTNHEKEQYFEIGRLIMTADGFSAFYEDSSPYSDIEFQLQQQIDSQIRSWLTVQKSQPFETNFMPLTQLTTLEWKPILDWLKDINDGSEIFNDGIFYKDIPPDKLHELYETGTELIGDLDEFKIALYEQKPLKSFQQERIDANVRKFLAKEERKAKDSFPWTSLTDTSFNDILRAIQLTSGNGFDLLLSHQLPPENFNMDVIIFTSRPPLLEDPMAALLDHFIHEPRIALTEAQQLILDNELLVFLEYNYWKTEYDKTRKANEPKMPTTSLTVREMAELKRIQHELYGDLFERGLSGAQLSDAEKEELL